MSENSYESSFEKDDQVKDVITSLARDRLIAFDMLYQGYERKEIADYFDNDPASLQPYVNDWKDYGLVEVNGKSTELTERGEYVHEVLVMLGSNLPARNIESILEGVEPGTEEADEVIDRLQED